MAAPRASCCRLAARACSGGCRRRARWSSASPSSTSSAWGRPGARRCGGRPATRAIHARCAGGSSGGSGSAVAARIVGGSIGSDSGGSTRIPAAYCGVVGLKTTWGSVPPQGYTGGVSTFSAAGAFGRDAGDARLLSEVLTARALPPGDGARMRCGVVRRPFWEDLDPEVEARCREALEAAGWELVELGARSRGALRPGRGVAAGARAARGPRSLGPRRARSRDARPRSSRR